MSLYQRFVAQSRQAEAQALPDRIGELTATVARLTAALNATPSVTLTIDGKAGHYVLKRSVHVHGAGWMHGYGTEWRYVSEAGMLTAVVGDAQHFTSAQAAMQRAAELTPTTFTLPPEEQDTGAWRVGRIHAVWKESNA